MGCIVPDIFPLAVGKKWIYKMDGNLLSIFSGDIKLEVMDKKNSIYLVKISFNNFELSLIVKSDVDLSIIGYSKKGVNKLDDSLEFENIPKIEVLKSPLIDGSTWTNNFGIFKVVSTDYNYDLGQKKIPGCLLLNIKDASDASNSICIKEGIGILFASLYIDNFGRINLSLKKFS